MEFGKKVVPHHETDFSFQHGTIFLLEVADGVIGIRNAAPHDFAVFRLKTDVITACRPNHFKPVACRCRFTHLLMRRVERDYKKQLVVAERLAHVVGQREMAHVNGIEAAAEHCDFHFFSEPGNCSSIESSTEREARNSLCSTSLAGPVPGAWFFPGAWVRFIFSTRSMIAFRALSMLVRAYTETGSTVIDGSFLASAFITSSAWSDAPSMSILLQSTMRGFEASSSL